MFSVSPKRLLFQVVASGREIDSDDDVDKFIISSESKSYPGEFITVESSNQSQKRSSGRCNVCNRKKK